VPEHLESDPPNQGKKLQHLLLILRAAAAGGRAAGITRAASRLMSMLAAFTQRFTTASVVPLISSEGT